MLEIKGLTKIYRSKTGEEVRALDGVDISFPETGMVFILGKSGSGKSTLLNIIGGLDKYDDGEFFIKGKSSRDFAGSDFDAYRNTFIGFIFQEYNVLDDFTVGANIALALELQGKKATPKAIGDILEQVDLTNYAKRKPNELSGGQKQRVAIARALVKDPQIIMADEPTGALDSATGKQIFDALKKLSETKLVLVVSHDRDFAERYADRIVELADGRIISDVTKHEHESERVSEGIDRIGGSILRIKAGYTLTAEDLNMINAYLSKNNADVILSGDSRVNNELRSAAGISETGATSVFEQTDTNKDYELKRYEKKDSKFIRSRLPMKKAIRMGASCLKNKRFRLVMTIFLSLIAFALFGFADTLAAYNKHTATVDSLFDSGIRNASVTLGVRHTSRFSDGDGSTWYNNELLNDEDVKNLSEQTGVLFVPVYTGERNSGYYSGFSVTGSMNEYRGGTSVYTCKLHGLVAMTEEQLSAAGLTVVGRLPNAEGEIAITELMYRQFKEYGLVDAKTGDSFKSDTLTMENDGSANSIIGKHFAFSSNGTDMTVRIVGVVDTHFDYDRYADFLPSDDNDHNTEEEDMISQMVLQMEIESEIGYGFHALGFVHEEDIKTLSRDFKYSKELGVYMSTGSQNMHLVVSGARFSSGKEGEDVQSYETTFNYVAGSDSLEYVSVSWLGDEKTELGKNEIILPISVLEGILPTNFVWKLDYDALDAFLTRKYGSDWTLDRGWFNSIYDNIRDAAIRHYGDIGDEAVTVRIKNDLYPFLLNSLGVTLPEGGITFASPNDDDLMNLLRNMTDEKGELTVYVENYNLTNILRYAYAEYAVAKHNLAKDDSFLDLLRKHYGTDTENMNEAEIRRQAIEFYSNYYLSWEDLGYSRNDYGLSGKEINAIEKDILAAKNQLDSQKIAGRISYTLSSYKWEDGIEVNTGTNTKNYTVVGFYQNSDYHNSMVISDTLLSDFKAWREENLGEYDYIEEKAEHVEGIWAYALAPMPKERSTVEKLVSMSYAEDGTDLRFELQNHIMDTLDNFNDFIEIGAKVAFYVGLGFALFSGLLLMNFIATSIAYKKRDIGVLRAVGARSSDVFKIFFSEAMIIALINFVCATAVVIAGVIFANFMMRREGITVTLLSYGIRQFLLMLGSSIGVALLASFLPVNAIARKKPVDAIKDK